MMKSLTPYQFPALISVMAKLKYIQKTVVCKCLIKKEITHMLTLNELKECFAKVNGKNFDGFKWYDENAVSRIEFRKTGTLNFLPFDEIHGKTILSKDYDNPGRDYGMYFYSNETINQLQEQTLKWFEDRLKSCKCMNLYDPNNDSLDPRRAAHCLYFERTPEVLEVLANCEFYVEMQRMINAYDIVCDLRQLWWT